MLHLVSLTALQAQTFGGPTTYVEQEAHVLPFGLAMHLDLLDVLWNKLFALHETALRLRSLHGSTASAANARQSLHLNARQIVSTAHQLQIHGWLPPDVLASAMQSITVLVLVADALVECTLIEPEVSHSYILLRSNIQRALSAVELLQVA